MNAEKNSLSQLYSFFPPEKPIIVLLMMDFNDPCVNLWLEDKILEYVAENTEITTIVRFWRNTECLVAGPRRSSHYGWYREEAAERMGVKIFTRSTAGGVVFHDLGNLNWSFYVKTGKTSFVSPISFFKSAAYLVCSVLRRFDVNANFTPPNRIDVDGYKVSGMAAHLTYNAALIHGTLLFNTNLKKLNELCIPPSGCPPVTNLCEINQKLTMQNFISHFCTYLRSQDYKVMVLKPFLNRLKFGGYPQQTITYP